MNPKLFLVNLNDTDLIIQNDHGNAARLKPRSSIELEVMPREDDSTPILFITVEKAGEVALEERASQE